MNYLASYYPNACARHTVDSDESMLEL